MIQSTDKPLWPEPWIGYGAKMIEGQFPLRICSWHKGAAEATAQAVEEGYVVTHSICVECSARLNAAFLGEREDEATDSSTSPLTWPQGCEKVLILNA